MYFKCLCLNVEAESKTILAKSPPLNRLTSLPLNHTDVRRVLCLLNATPAGQPLSATVITESNVAVMNGASTRLMGCSGWVVGGRQTCVASTTG